MAVCSGNLFFNGPVLIKIKTNFIEIFTRVFDGFKISDKHKAYLEHIPLKSKNKIEKYMKKYIV